MRESNNIIRVQLAKRDQAACPNCPTAGVTGFYCQGKLRKKKILQKQASKQHKLGIYIKIIHSLHPFKGLCYLNQTVSLQQQCLLWHHSV